MHCWRQIMMVFCVTVWRNASTEIISASLSYPEESNESIGLMAIRA
jgi:hypothetical protein